MFRRKHVGVCTTPTVDTSIFREDKSGLGSWRRDAIGGDIGVQRVRHSWPCFNKEMHSSKQLVMDLASASTREPPPAPVERHERRLLMMPWSLPPYPVASFQELDTAGFGNTSRRQR